MLQNVVIRITICRQVLPDAAERGHITSRRPMLPDAAECGHMTSWFHSSSF
jgi:hypothetical protein